MTEMHDQAISEPGDVPIAEQPAATTTAGPPPRSYAKVTWAALFAIVLLASVLRIYNLRDLPAGLYCDEAGLGYNAFTIATNGTDETNHTFPLFFWSFGVSYKNPAFIYAAAPIVRLLGNTEFSIRLTSALFGIGTVIGMFFLGRALMGPWLGLAAALFLAVEPWHLHFSRIAFELISFPFFFVIALTNFVRFVQGKRSLWVAMLFFGLCFYAYKVANLFVPVFVAGAVLLFLPTFFRRWRESLVAVAVLAAVVGPVVVFELQHRDLSTRYFSNTTHLRFNEPMGPQISRTIRYYQEFFSREFLFQNGDPIVRHAVRGFGELHPFYLPFLILGTLAAFVWRNRITKLLVWWLFLYPVAPSLMTEIPSASRGIMGAPIFALMTAFGFVVMLRVVGWAGYFRPLKIALQLVAVIVSAAVLGQQMRDYWTSYVNEYPKYSAPTYGGFQYGYRDALAYMEAHRKEYDLLLMTAVEVNQPQIFPLYYNYVPPGKEIGYLILNPAEFGRYSDKQRILAALRDSDLDLFSDYEIKKTITAPGGQTEFIITDVKARKKFLTNWLVLGLFQDDGDGMEKDFIDIQHLSRDRIKGPFGEVFWRRIAPQFVLVDMNQHFAHSDTRNPGNPEHVCAYAAVTVRSQKAQQAFFEISGTDDYFRLWLNGRNLTPFPIMLGEAHQKRPIDLRQGDNLLLLKTCENVGGWAFKARITDEQGIDIDTVTTSPDLPEGEIVPAALPADSDLQLVGGLGEVLAFKHHHDEQADYRGKAEAWWAMVGDLDSEVVWKTQAPTAQKRTVFAYTASTSNEKGEAELFVDGKFALNFDLDDDRRVRTWRRGDYALTFAPKASIAGNSGVYLLSVPAAAITPGKPVELHVIPARGAPEAWFALKNYKDTIEHEKLTAEGAIEALRTGWSPEQTAEAPKLPDRKGPAPAASELAKAKPEPAKAGSEQKPAAATAAAPAGAAANAAASDSGEPTGAPPAKGMREADTGGVRRFVYRGGDQGAAADSEVAAGAGVEPDGSLSLPLNQNPQVGPNGEPVHTEGVEFDKDGAFIAEDGKLIVPGVGDMVGDSGSISFWVEPGWDGTEAGNHSFVQLRDPRFWENRVQVFKDGDYLRFLFTPDSGHESGVGIDIKEWAQGDRHQVTTSWADGMTSMYVDGQLVGQQPYDGKLQLPPGTSLYIGSDHPGGAPSANSRIGGLTIRPNGGAQ